MPSASAAAPPAPPVRSRTVTDAPASRAACAAHDPAAPNPTTTTSHSASHRPTSAIGHGSVDGSPAPAAPSMAGILADPGDRPVGPGGYRSEHMFDSGGW